MPARFRPPYEIWGNFQAASGARLALIPELLDAEESKALDGHELTLDLALGYGASGQLQEGRVLRSVWSDGTFDEWRIQAVQPERKEDGGLVAKVTAVDPRVVLGDVLVFRTEADGSHTYSFSQTLTAAEHLSKFILPALVAEGYTWVAAGTITPTQPIELAYDYSSALGLIQLLAQGLTVEFDFRRNGTTQYLIDLVTQVGASATRLEVRYARNLTGFTKIPDGGEVATRVIPRGADEGGFRAGCGRAQWKVTAVDTGNDDVTLADPLGGAGPILEDDQLNGKYLRRPSGTLDAIVDTFAATQKIRVADASLYAVNDLVEFRRTAGGEMLDFVESPLYGVVPPSGYGLRVKVLDRPDLSGTVNVLANPAMRTYSTATDAPPDNWNLIPGCGLAAANVDKETTAAFWRVGGQSAKVVAGGDGQGLETDWATIAPTDAAPYVSGYQGFWNDTNGARVRVAIILGLATVAISGTPTRATAGGITTVTVSTSAAHGLTIGDLVEVLGLTGGTTADGYNGIRKVSRVVDADTFEYQLTADPGTVSVSSPTIRKVWRFLTTGNPASKVWSDYGVEGINAKELAAITVKTQIMQDGSVAATFYADRAQLTETAAQRAFIEGNGQTRLWQEATNYLQSHRQPPTRYEVSLLDLGRIDPAIWSYDDVVLGGGVAVADPEVATPFATRIVGVRRKPLIDGRTTIELSTKFDDLTDQLGRPDRPTLPAKPLPPPQRRVVQVRFQAAKFVPKTAADAGRLTYNIAGTPGLYCNSTTAGEATASVADDLLAYGGRIVGMLSDLQLITAGTGTLKLYRDTTLLATLTATTDLTQAILLLSELISTGAAYSIDASLAQVSSTIFPFFTYVTLLVELDESAPRPRLASASLAAPAPGTILTVEDFGAVGDGATDDTAALLKAIAALKAQGGGVLRLGGGSIYNFSTGLVIDGDGMVLEGQSSGIGSRGTVLNWTGGAAVAVTVSGGPTTNVSNSLRRLAVHNSGTGTVGIDYTDIPYEVALEDLVVDGDFSDSQIRIGNAGSVSALVVNLIHCRLTGGAGWGLKVIACNVCTLIGSRVYLNAAGEIRLGDATHLVAAFAQFGGSVEALANITAISLLNVESATWHGTYFEHDGSGYLIDVPSSATLADSVALFGCRMLGNAWGNSTPYVVDLNLSTAVLGIYDCFGKGYPGGAVWVRNQASRRAILTGVSHPNANLSIGSSLAGITYIGGGSGSANFGIRTAGDLVVDGDADAGGGYRTPIDGWYQENVAASQTAVALTRLATTTEVPTRWIAGRAGSVTGVSVKSSAARTNGTCTILVYKNGSALGSLTAVLDGTNTTFKATTQGKDVDGFVAGDELELRVTTDGTWAPTTADIRAALEIET